MITYIKGNVFESDDDVLVHGCNIFNTMRSGVAAQVVRHYPDAYYKADALTLAGDINKIGTYTSWTGKNVLHDKQITIVNAYTQTTFGRSKSFVFADYGAIKDVMTQIKNDFKGKTICMPKIGAGLANGNWNIIEQILLLVFGGVNINIYILE